MDCKEFREMADLYVDGELSAEATVAAVAHLNDCRACRAIAADLKGLRLALKRVVAQYEPPPQLVSDVRRLTEPRWRRILGDLRTSDSKADRRAAPPSFWKLKVSLPAPVFALLLIALGTLGAWGLWLRRVGPMTKRNVAGVEDARPAPARSRQGGMDLSRYDGGERASLYKVRQADLEKASQ